VQDVSFLTAEQIIDLHEEECGDRIVSSRHLLESAVAAPLWQQRLHYQAAALFRSLVKNHAFVDGNKRTAVVAVMTFLRINGYTIRAREDTIFRFVLRVAEASNPDVSWIAGWFRRHMASM
jgi:death-on-curing protein